jgi:GntR family transcriptional regulator of vanillate catabolism
MDEEPTGARVAMNAALHAAMVEAAGNTALARALAMVDAPPSAGASAPVPRPASGPQRQRAVTLAHRQHHLLVEALKAGQGMRAEALAREHADNARRNPRLMLEAGDAGGFGALIAPDDAA